MKEHSYLVILIALLSGTLVISTTAFAQTALVVFVDSTSTNVAAPSGSNPGNTWAGAYKFLQSGLERANQLNPTLNPVEVWVRAGIYYPDLDSTHPTCQTPPDRARSFNLRTNVAILGGFVTGMETNKNQRNPYVNVTTLSGDLNEDDNLADIAGTFDDNSHHIVRSTSTALATVAASALLDGFTIKHGNADYFFVDLSSDDERVGGGLFIDGRVSSTIPNQPTIVRCRFDTNLALHGGAVCVNAAQNSNPRFYDCTVTDNRARSDGGAVCVKDMSGGGSTPILVNCLLAKNLAGRTQPSEAGRGGAVHLKAQGGMTLVNCTVADNTSHDAGQTSAASAIHYDKACQPLPEGPEVMVINCILYGNTGGPQMVGFNRTSYSTVQGIAVSTDGICVVAGDNDDSNPLFMNAGGGDYQLSSASPAIDAGNTSNIQAYADSEDVNQNGDVLETLPDLALRTRIAPGSISANGNCLLVDRGAYEYRSFNCTGDIAPAGVGDGVVNVTDLLLVITSWGICPAAPSVCFADIAPEPCTNAVVDVGDLLAVITHWGSCGGVFGDEGGIAGIPQSYHDCEDLCNGLTGQDWADCMAKCFNVLCQQGQTEYCDD